jgi:uncharacterized protein YjiS (DUF1127 family)
MFAAGAAWLMQAWSWLDRSLVIARQRRELSKLDGIALKDVGLTAADVEFQASRPFWDHRLHDPRH